MVAAHKPAPSIGAPDESPEPEPAGWLTLPQAACELGLSETSVRRMIRKGKLKNRIVPRRGGYSYLVHIPGARHLQGPCSTNGNGADADRPAAERHVRELEHHVERLAEALSRALRVKQRVLPTGMGEPYLNPNDPYARYRWLVRRRKWWPFG
jgi:hypothetical protein